MARRKKRGGVPKQPRVPDDHILEPRSRIGTGHWRTSEKQPHVMKGVKKPGKGATGGAVHDARGEYHMPTGAKLTPTPGKRSKSGVEAPYEPPKGYISPTRDIPKPTRPPKAPGSKNARRRNRRDKGI